MVAALGSRGDPATAAQQAYGVIYGILVRQAMLLSYLDIFRWLALLCLVGIPATFLFKRVRASKAPVAAH